MAKEFGINDGEDGQKDSLVLVKSWLETEFLEPWVMVIDNVDDETVFFREKCRNGKTPSQIFPRCSHGQLLFTSRTRDVAVDLASPAAPISVDFLTREEGMELLRSRLGPDPPEAHLVELLFELEHIPLAVTQAISFILKRRKTVQQYLQLYRTSDNTRSRLLSHEFLDHGRQEQTMESVARTWQISFEWIQRHHTQAAEMLCLMAFYQHHDVPEQLLRGDDVDDLEFDESIAVLQAFSLVGPNKAETSYSTHRLIQVTTKFWLEQNGPAEVEKWAFQALELLTMWFPTPIDVVRDDYWEKCRSLLPHADILLEQSFNIDMRGADLQKAELLLGTGAYIRWVDDNMSDVHRRFERSLEIRQNHLGSKHPETLSSMGFYFQSFIRSTAVYPPNIGSQGVADMGYALLNHEREVFGDRHQATIQTLNDLANFLGKQRKFKDSETMQREALRLSEEVNGLAANQTANCMRGLSSVLRRTGRFEEALELQMQSTKIREEILGREHREILAEKSDLALCFANMGRLDEANVLGREVMELKEKVLGTDHQETLVTARNLAMSLAEDKMYEEALEILGHILSTIQVSRRLYLEPITVQNVLGLKQEFEDDMVAKQLAEFDVGSNRGQVLERRRST